MGHLVRDWRRTGEQPPAHLLLPGGRGAPGPFMFGPLKSVIGQYRFYEKVVKVKADVAAILHSFLPSDHVRSGPTSGRRYIG